MNIKNKTAGHAGIACFSFALKGNRAGSPHFKIVRFKWWEHVTRKSRRRAEKVQKEEAERYVSKYSSH